jgi:hypothetical protein
VELIAVERSQLVNLFLARRLSGQLHAPAVNVAIVERYQFATHPRSIEEMTKEPISYGHGLFGDTAIEAFDIYSDGVVVSSKSDTEVLDAFMGDVLDWTKSAFGLDHIEIHTISKVYESNILFRSDPNLLDVLSPLMELSEAISDYLSKTSSLEARFLPFGLIFAADTSTIAGLKPAPFRVERKAGLEFSMNIYASTAPLRTRDHLALLRTLEALRVAALPRVITEMITEHNVSGFPPPPSGEARARR